MPVPMGLRSRESDMPLMKYVEDENRVQRLALGLEEDEVCEEEVRWKMTTVRVDSEGKDVHEHA